MKRGSIGGRIKGEVYILNYSRISEVNWLNLLLVKDGIIYLLLRDKRSSIKTKWTFKTFFCKKTITMLYIAKVLL